MLSEKQEVEMSERAIEFVENWTSEHIQAEGYQPEGDLTLARTYAAQCIAEAKEAGIPVTEINESFENMVDFMSGEIEEANDREVDRQLDKDRS
jgi:hypothetical protein